MAKAEGRVFPFEPPSKIHTDYLETILYRGQPQLVEYTTREFSAVCPYSGLPDLGTVTIQYVPCKRIIELKSLKYYLVSFRCVGITQEEATNRIFHDLKKQLQPTYLKLATSYNTRGGIDSTCTMEFGKPNFKLTR